MERNSKSGVIGVIITIIILVLLVVFTNRNTENISTIENFANVVIVPIQNGLTYLKNKINNIYPYKSFTPSFDVSIC